MRRSNPHPFLSGRRQRSLPTLFAGLREQRLMEASRHWRERPLPHRPVLIPDGDIDALLQSISNSLSGSGTR